MLNGGSDKPAGVPDDAFTLRVISKSGDKYDMQTIDDAQYTMASDHFEVLALGEDAGRDFLSRDQSALYLRPDTAAGLGLDWDSLQKAAADQGD